jgi:hypothetical protein
MSFNPFLHCDCTSLVTLVERHHVKVELLGFWFFLVHVARHEISEKFFSRCGGAQVKLNVEVTFAPPSRSF